MMKSKRSYGDWLTWMALAGIAILIAVSLVALSNADWYSGRARYEKQVVWFLLGGIFFAISALVDLRLLERASFLLYGGCVVLLIATAFFGTEVNNSIRWLRFGGFNLQASEITKLGVVLALARWLHGRKERVPGEAPRDSGPYRIRDLMAPAILIAVPAFLILRQPDLGTTLVVGLGAASVLLYEGLDRRSLVAAVFVALVIVPTAWQYGGIKDYQKDRVVGCINDDWLKLDPDTGIIVDNRSLQSEQAVWAIGSGQFWGQGSRSGAQSRLKYLPEMHTDMILATFAEEQGFVGCSLLLAVYWFIIFWCLRTAADARDRFPRLLAVGVAGLVGWQAFINIGMVAGMLPIVGLTLPMVSYGGSSIMTTMVGLGLVLNISLRRGRL